MAWFSKGEPVVVKPGDPIIFSEKLYPRTEDPEVAKFGDFCEKYYKELFGQDLTLWQRAFLEHCFKSKELRLKNDKINPYSIMMEKMIIKSMLDYDSRQKHTP